MSRENPAGRLYETLSAIRALSNMTMSIAWATVFQIDASDRTELMRRLTALHELVDEVRAKVSSLPGINAELYLAKFNDIQAFVMGSNIDGQLDSFRGSLNETSMFGLQHCVEALQVYDEERLDADALAELSSNINALTERLHDSTIDPQLKLAILDMLEMMRRSIAEYKVRGAAGMKKELNYCIGTFALNHARFEKEKDNEDVGMFRRLVSRFGSLIDLALKMKQLGMNSDTAAALLDYFK